MHLLLADDGTIFCQNEIRQLINLCCILMWFEGISAFHVSELIQIKRWETIDSWPWQLDAKWEFSDLLHRAATGGRNQGKAHLTFDEREI